MFGGSGMKAEEIDRIVTQVSDRIIRLQSKPALAYNTVETAETRSLATSIRELTAALSLHLQIAKVRVGLETVNLGASETMIDALTNLSKVAKENRLTEEVARRADSLVKALRTAEQKGLLDELCEKAGRGFIPHAEEAVPKKNYFGS